MTTDIWEGLAREAGWCSTVSHLAKGKERILKRRILLAEKYKARDARALVIKVLRQALTHGIDYVLSNVSTESREVYMRARSISREMRNNLVGSKDELWNAYYDACYIERRKNRRLTLQRIPKKYWGHMDKKEREKMNRGIQKQRLDGWI
jgi:hypothetical protein